MSNSFLSSSIQQFKYYKLLGEKAIAQLPEKELFFTHHEASNSIAVIVNHLCGNMLSRWTNFLSEDGEKSWRNRDEEFNNIIISKEDLLKKWNEGWDCLLGTIENLQEADLEKIIYIRNEGHSVTEAINRQLCHYAYHVGQLVFLARLLKGEKWKSLSIPKGNSKQFNEDKFNQEKRKKHFTE